MTTQKNLNDPSIAIRYVQVPADMSAEDRATIRGALYRGAQHVISLRGEDYHVWHSAEHADKSAVTVSNRTEWVAVRADLCDDYARARASTRSVYIFRPTGGVQVSLEKAADLARRLNEYGWVVLPADVQLDVVEVTA